MSPRRLFTGPPLRRTLDDATSKLLTAAANLSPDAWQADADGTPRDPAADLAAQAVFTVPVIDWSAATTRTGEATVIAGWSNSSPSERRSTPVAGTSVVVSVPHIGTAALLSSRPSLHYIGGFDPTVTLRGRFIDISTVGRHMFAATVDAHLGRVQADLTRYLDSTTTDLATWRTSVTKSLRYEVDARAAYLASLGALTTALAHID